MNEESTTEFSSDTTEKLSTSETITSTSAGKVNYRINLPIDPELLDYYPVGKLFFYIFFTKGQLNSERIYEVIVSPKIPTKNSQISALPSN